MDTISDDEVHEHDGPEPDASCEGDSDSVDSETAHSSVYDEQATRPKRIRCHPERGFNVGEYLRRFSLSITYWLAPV